MRAPSPAAHIERLQPYVPGKPVEEVQREHGLQDVIKLASNENPLGPSPLALGAICAAAERVYQYPDASCHLLVRALADHWRVGPEQVIVPVNAIRRIDLGPAEADRARFGFALPDDGTNERGAEPAA